MCRWPWSVRDFEGDKAESGGRHRGHRAGVAGERVVDRGAGGQVPRPHRAAERDRRDVGTDTSSPSRRGNATRSGACS